MTVSPLPDDRLNDAAGLLKVLAHPARLRLALHLMRGEASVAAMEHDLGIRQPNLSQHLGELREAALVTTRREHKVVFYTLNDGRTVDLLSVLSDLFGDGQRRTVRRKSTSRSASTGGAAMFALTGDAV